MPYETILLPPEKKTIQPPTAAEQPLFFGEAGAGVVAKEPEKKEEKKDFLNTLKIVGNIALDIGIMALGARLGGPVGGAAGVFLKNAASAGLSLERAYKIIKGAETVGKIVGETAALSGLEVARGKKAEEAIRGALDAQILGLLFPRGIRTAIWVGKKIIPESVRKPIAEAIKNTVHKWLFDSQISKKFYDSVLPDAVRLLGNKEHIHRLASREFSQMIQSGDYQKLGQLVAPYLRDAGFYEHVGVKQVPSADKMEKIIRELTELPKNKQSAVPYVLLELSQFIRHAYGDKAVNAFAKKYPVLFKDHQLYKWATEDYFSLISKEISPERLGHIETFVGKTIPDSVKIAAERTNALVSGIRNGFIDDYPKHLEETQTALRNAITAIHSAQKQGIVAKEASRQLSDVVALFNKADLYLSKITPSSLKEFTRIKAALDDVVGNLNSSSAKILGILQSMPSIKGSGIYNDLRALHDHLVDVRGYLKRLAGMDELVSSRRISEVAEIANTISSKLKDIGGLSAEAKKTLQSSLRDIATSAKTIETIYLYRHGLTKEYKRATDVISNAMRQVEEVFPNLAPRDIKSMYDFAHKVYYSRIGLPPKIAFRPTEAEEKTLEYQMEHVLSQYRQDFGEIFSHLKQRRYPTLFSKYYEEISSGIHPVFDPRYDFPSAIAATYVLPQSLRQYRNWLYNLSDDLVLDRPLVGYHPMETKLIPGVLREANKIPKEFASQYKTIQVAGEQFFVNSDVMRWLDRMLHPVLSGRSNIFQSGKGLWGGVSTMNTLAKRIAVMFGVIHMKSLSTAAYGIGETKSLAKAWRAFFSGDRWFYENVVPLQEEVVRAINDYRLKTKFLLPDFDDPREMLQRLRLGEKLQPVIDIIDKTGVLKVSGELDKRLWDRLFYTLKASAANKIVQDLKAGRISKETAEKLLDSVTSAFGGNYEWLYMKPGAREFIRFMLFAPDWYLSLTRHFTKSVSGDVYFADFFRRIFLLHYVLANEVSWNLNRKTTYEQFLETGDWNDLFRVPLYSIDKKTGQWKKSYLNFLGFEIEALQLLGVLFVLDGFHELMTTNKTLKQVANDVASKWVNYILSAKRSSILRMVNDVLQAADKKSLSFLLRALPVPILGSAMHTLLDRHVVFTQSGEKAPAELILPLYQMGIKYHATELVSEGLRKDLLRIANEEEANKILSKYATEIATIGEKLRNVPVKYKLESDNPKTIFENSLRVAIAYHINSRWADEIETAVAEKKDLTDIYQRILASFDGTVISYHPKFKDILASQIMKIARISQRRERYEEVE